MIRKIAIVFFMLTAILAADEVYFEERILAVVDDEVVTSSEAEVALLVELGGSLPEDSALVHDLLSAKVEEIVNEKLILLAAEAESIEVDPDRIDEMFDSRWAMLIEGYGGEVAFENELRQEGFTIEGFKRKTREQLEDLYLKQAYIENHFGRIPVTEAEVDSFYKVYRDSLPDAPPEVHLLGIAVRLEPDSATINAALARLAEARKRIDAGEDFSTVAAELSEDSTTASKGGKFGTFGRGDLTGELDSIAFALGYGEVGGPVKTPMGYHLVKVVDKAGGEVTIAYILARAELKPERFAELVALADTIYKEAKAKPESFEGLPDEFSSYNDVVDFTDYGWVPLTTIQPDFLEEIRDASDGDIVGPIEMGDVLEIYKVAGKRESRVRTIEEDRNLIREAARQLKMRRSIDEELERLRKQFYVEIRI
ncbi:hypothetical protein DRQ36_04805 [bacterium]|nr:MAG: hypothetical protein DRQ36_04805 [bacterium]